ncbi:MAG: hypothetical protein L6Q99_19415 [Planctomycetes bacterium]|nr:hypothetical protein [Planctomycetota bacterium]
MNSWIVLPVAVAAAAATAFTVTEFRPQSAAAQPASAAVATVPPEWERKFEALLAENQKLHTELELLRQAIDSRAPLAQGAGALDSSVVEAAVARALEARGHAVAAAPVRAEGATAAPEFADAQSAFDELLRTGTYEGREELWKRIRDAGLLDEVVAEFEARAEADPQDPELRLDLGQAYLQKIFAAGQGPEAGKWAIKADQAFDDALALDDHHWKARFFKATSLSFWPPIFGKQAEAIHQFEILAEQQKTQPKQADFAQTHLWLGNLYQQTGQLEKAKGAWSQGLALFPGDAELAAKLEAAGN